MFLDRLKSPYKPEADKMELNNLIFAIHNTSSNLSIDKIM